MGYFVPLYNVRKWNILCLMHSHNFSLYIPQFVESIRTSCKVKSLRCILQSMPNNKGDIGSAYQLF